MIPRTFLGALTALVLATGAVPANAAEGPAIPARDWTFEGIFGTFDRAALRRGFQVYSEVCASCHSMSLIYYRNLGAIGFKEEEIKKIAAEAEFTDGPNDEGEMFERPGRPTDLFKAPFPNEKAARAGNNGAMPPDLSLTVKARPGGADYVHALLTGYRDPPPKGVELPEGMSYNAAFSGGQIAMPPPLSDDGGRVRRRDQGKRRSDGGRRRHLPCLDLGARARGAQADGDQGDSVPDRLDRDALCGEAQDLGEFALEPAGISFVPST